jgi:hypothetical protein
MQMSQGQGSNNRGPQSNDRSNRSVRVNTTQGNTEQASRQTSVKQIAGASVSAVTSQSQPEAGVFELLASKVIVHDF